MLSVRLGSSLLPAAVAWLLVCLMVSPVTVTAFTPCNKPCVDNNAFPITFPTSSGITANMFNRYVCLLDPSVDCRLAHEFSSRRTFPANAWYGPEAHCESCFLYFKYCAKKDGTMNTGTLKFVNNGASPVSDTEHALVMPDQPCRGVESWESARCGKEAAWDAAFEYYKEKKGNPKSYFGYVIAVNSMRRRTQHQLHLHVGRLTDGVKEALKQGHNWAKGQKKQFRIACTKAAGKDITCSFDPNKQAEADNTIDVVFGAGATPLAAKPFETIYKPNKSPPNDETQKYSMGVVASADNQWLILKLLGGAAECLMKDNDSQKKCTVTKSRRSAADAAAVDVDAAATAGGGEVSADDVAMAAEAVPGGDGSSSVTGRRLKL